MDIRTDILVNIPKFLEEIRGQGGQVHSVTARMDNMALSARDSAPRSQSRTQCGDTWPGAQSQSRTLQYPAQYPGQTQVSAPQSNQYTVASFTPGQSQCQETQYGGSNTSTYLDTNAAPVHATYDPQAFHQPQQEAGQLAVFSRGRARGRGFVQPSRRTFCRTCYDADKGKSVFYSHNMSDARCPIRMQLSAISDDFMPADMGSKEEA